MDIRLDSWVRSLCQETIMANADFVLAQRNTFMALLQDEYHQFFLNENCFMNIEDMKFSMYFVKSRLSTWQKFRNFFSKNRKINLERYRICNASTPNARHCEVTISRAKGAFTHEIKLDGEKLKNKEVYVEET